MKKFLLICLLAVIGVISANAQTWTFRTIGYSQKELKSYGWTSWSKWYDSNMTITMDLNRDIVTVYSPKTQKYKIIDYSDPYMDSGAQCVDYHFIDQDGDKGTMSLVMKPSGQSEIYIRFANVQWAYVVVRTN